MTKALQTTVETRQVGRARLDNEDGDDGVIEAWGTRSRRRYRHGTRCLYMGLGPDLRTWHLLTAVVSFTTFYYFFTTFFYYFFLLFHYFFLLFTTFSLEITKT